MVSQKTINLAILFAEIRGSSRLTDVIGDNSARTKIAECLEGLATITMQQGGTLIKTIGDEVMCTFPSAEAAASAACLMHELLEDDVTEHGMRGPISLAVRVGMQYGPAILEDGDAFGDAVNVAARMVAMAKTGQILTTREVVENLPPILAASTRIIDRATVKGKKESMDIYEVIWQQEDVTRMSVGVISDPPTAPVKLRLTYQSESVVLDDAINQVVMGRSKTADITVNESLASRQHVRIERRRGKFFIVDQSTNGTYVHHNDNQSFLRREEMPISGSGKISLGRSFNEDPQNIVHFSSEG